MAVFNAQVNVGAVDIKELDDKHLEVELEIFMPFPAGPGQAVPIHLGTLRFPINKEPALNLAKDLKEKGEKLAQESGLIEANDMGAVEEAAKKLEDLKKGNFKP